MKLDKLAVYTNEERTRNEIFFCYQCVKMAEERLNNYSEEIYKDVNMDVNCGSYYYSALPHGVSCLEIGHHNIEDT